MKYLEVPNKGSHVEETVNKYIFKGCKCFFFLALILLIAAISKKGLLAVTVIYGCFFLLNLVECNDFKLLWIRVTAK